LGNVTAHFTPKIVFSNFLMVTQRLTSLSDDVAVFKDDLKPWFSLGGGGEYQGGEGVPRNVRGFYEVRGSRGCKGNLGGGPWQNQSLISNSDPIIFLAAFNIILRKRPSELSRY
jgi:hypothetical protein